MIRVDVPDKNTFVEFPDGTSPEIIEKAIRENFYNQPKKKPSFRIGSPEEQFVRIVNIQQEEAKSGMEAMGEFAEKPSGRTALRAALGGIQYLASPITAVTRGAFREAAEVIPRELGAPEIVTKTIGEGAEQAAYVLPYGAAVRSAIKGGGVIEKSLEAQRVGLAATKQAEKTVSKLKPGKLPREEIPPTAQHLELMPEEFPKISSVAVKQGEKVFKDHVHGEIIAKHGLDPEKAIPGFVTKEGKFVEQYPKGKPSLEYVKEPTEKVVQELSAIGKLSKPVIEETLQKQVVNAAEQVLTKLPPNEKKRIGQQVIELVHSDQINWKELPDILKKYDITAEEFAQRLKDTYSTAGRTLNRLSIVSKQVAKTFKDNPEAQKFFNDFIKELPEPNTTDRIMNAFINLEKTRRGFLVTQLATAMRNTLSQAGRATIGSIDDAMQGAIRGTIGGEGHPLKQAGEGLDTFVALWNRVSPSGRKRLSDIMNSEQATLATTKMLSAPVHEVNLGSKMAKVLNTFNNAQEHFFRKMAFESKLTQLLERQGMNIKNIDPNKIPKGMLEEAAEYSLEMTFSAMPKSQFGKKFVKDIAGNPIATALVNPFPRFAFGNALPYLINFSPISFMKAMNPKVVAELANGNPEQFAKNASRATLGMLQLGLAHWLRNSEYRGEKWHEVKVGNKYYDVRSYAPLLAPYMLVSEAMTHPEKLKTADWAQAAIGLNRVAGTGLVLTDIIRGKDVDSTMKLFGRLAGEYLGSFSVPARTFQDIYSGIKPESSAFRDVREDVLTGPFRRNIPGLAETLPESVSPLKSEIPKPESPVLRQLTGLSRKTKTLMEREVDTLGIESFRIAPKTGEPKADRELSRYMGPVIEQIAPRILENPNYQKMDDPRRRLVLAKIFAQARLYARNRLAKDNPELAKKMKIESLQSDIREILQQFQSGGD